MTDEQQKALDSFIAKAASLWQTAGKVSDLLPEARRCAELGVSGFEMMRALQSIFS